MLCVVFIVLPCDYFVRNDAINEHICTVFMNCLYVNYMLFWYSFPSPHHKYTSNINIKITPCGRITVRRHPSKNLGLFYSCDCNKWSLWVRHCDVTHWAVSQWPLAFNFCISVTWPLTCAFHILYTHTPEIIDMHRGVCDDTLKQQTAFQCINMWLWYFSLWLR